MRREIVRLNIEINMIEWTRSSLTKMFFFYSPLKLRPTNQYEGCHCHAIHRQAWRLMIVERTWQVSKQKRQDSCTIHWITIEGYSLLPFDHWEDVCAKIVMTHVNNFNHCAGQHNWDRWPSSLVTQICPKIWKDPISWSNVKLYHLKDFYRIVHMSHNDIEPM